VTRHAWICFFEQHFPTLRGCHQTPGFVFRGLGYTQDRGDLSGRLIPNPVFSSGRFDGVHTRFLAVNLIFFHGFIAFIALILNK
jgi:hypothetical protein